MRNAASVLEKSKENGLTDHDFWTQKLSKNGGYGPSQTLRRIPPSGNGAKNKTFYYFSSQNGALLGHQNGAKITEHVEKRDQERAW